MTTLPSPYRATGTYIPRDGGMAEIVWRAPDRYEAALLPWIEAHDLDPKKIKKGGALITVDGTTKLLHVTEYVADEDGRRRADPVTGEVPTRSVVVSLKLDPPVESA
jgi:hypothetical protein